MHRLLGILSLFLFAVSVAYAIPARPLYLPEEAPKAPVAKATAISLNNTAWLGKYNTINRIFVFEADGTLSYRNPTTKTIFKGRGSWRLEGTSLYFEHSLTKGNTIMEFRGTVSDANTIVGESVTKAGAKAMQTLQRTPLDDTVVLPKKKVKVN